MGFFSSHRVEAPANPRMRGVPPQMLELVAGLGEVWSAQTLAVSRFLLGKPGLNKVGERSRLASSYNSTKMGVEKTH